MTFPLQIERDRGRKEAGQQLKVLKEKWPLAFPTLAQNVRPLAMGVANQIAETMGWSLSYSVGVLTYWKMSATYCRAVLDHDQRITLDGTPVDAVDELCPTAAAFREPREVGNEGAALSDSLLPCRSTMSGSGIGVRAPRPARALIGSRPTAAYRAAFSA
jgi:ProQ/FINO family